MSYSRSTTVDSGPTGDTVVQAVLDLDTDLTAIYTDLNTHEALTTGAHGITAGEGDIVGTDALQTLTRKTISNPTLTGVITTSGATISGGLTFPATQVASEGANVLDDYEEGTWTPALTASSCTFTYSKQYGGYTKVGRLILAHFEIATTGAPSGVTTNNVQMNAPIAGINPSGFTTHAAGMSYAPLLDSDGQVAIVYLHNPSDSEKSIASIFTGQSYFNGVLMYNTTA